MLQCIICKNNLVHYKTKILILLNSSHDAYIRGMQLKSGNWKPSQHLRKTEKKSRKWCRYGRSQNYGVSLWLLASKPANKRWKSPHLSLAFKLLLQIHAVQKPSIIPVTRQNSSHIYNTLYIVSLFRYRYVVWAVLSATYRLSIWSSWGICLMLPVRLIIRMFWFYLPGCMSIWRVWVSSCRKSEERVRALFALMAGIGWWWLFCWLYIAGGEVQELRRHCQD
jgi:hypothetical protein